MIIKANSVCVITNYGASTVRSFIIIQEYSVNTHWKYLGMYGTPKYKPTEDKKYIAEEILRFHFCHNDNPEIYLTVKAADCF